MAATVLLLCLVIGFWLGFRDSSPEAREAVVNATARTPAVPNPAPMPSTRAPAPDHNPAPLPPGARQAPPAELPPDESPEPEPPGIRFPQPGTLLFVTFNNRPAPGIRVVLSYHRHPSPEVDKSLVEEKVTDENGEIELAGTFGSGMAVKVKSDGWQIAPGPLTVEDDWHIAGSLAILVERTRRIHVAAHYADGQPYDGDIQVGRRSTGTEEAVPMTRGTTDLTVPADDPFWISVYSRRPGFASTGGNYSRDEPAPDTVRFVLEPDKSDLGVIEVDLTAFARSDQLLVEFIGVPPLWSEEFRARTSGGGVYISPPRRPGGYRVFVREDPDGSLYLQHGKIPPSTARASLRAWQSDIVPVAAGETTRVVALSQKASAVRARLVNERGEALAPGILFVEPDLKAPTVWHQHETWYNQPKPWSSIKRRPPWLTLEDGTAELPLVDPGKRVIGCEAPGYDLALIEVECRPGELHDLGTIVLKPATGVIEIEIVNFDPNLTYSVKLGAFLGDYLQAGITLDGTTGPKYKFKGLPLRWYFISVNNNERKVGAWSRAAKLSPTRTTARLKFEMHTPPLPPKVNQPDEE